MTVAKPVFRDYFQNVDYSNPTMFLQHGEQTRLTPEILAVAQLFNIHKDISTLREIYLWMFNNLRDGDGDKFGRTAHEIVSSRIVTGCTDWGLVFATLARAKGVPAIFVQAGWIRWIKKVNRVGQCARPVYGHIFVEAYIDSQWCLVDSMRGFLYRDYDADSFCLPHSYYIFAKSIEVWDTGVRNLEENNRVMTRLFTGFDTSRYQKPVYKKKRLRPWFCW